MEMITINQALPERAGKADISYDAKPQDGELPSRNGKMIRLPLHRTAEFFPLMGGEQFLYRARVLQMHAYHQEDVLYFGGTDEEPFLVRLDPDVFREFSTGGEENFFASLVPRGVKQARMVFGRQYRRQGDIFAVPVNFSWKNLRALEMIRSGYVEPERLAQFRPSETPLKVFGTRHELSGVHMESHIGISGGGSLIAEGVLEAPDHADLELKQPHLLFQTAHLFNPQQAD